MKYTSGESIMKIPFENAELGECFSNHVDTLGKSWQKHSCSDYLHIYGPKTSALNFLSQKLKF